MTTSETTIRTDRPGRYLVQFCRHAAAMGETGGGHHTPGPGETGGGHRAPGSLHVEYTETHGVVTLGSWGRCTLRAAAGALTLRVEAADQDALRRIQGIVTRDLERFGRRERLTVSWSPGISEEGQ